MKELTAKSGQAVIRAAQGSLIGLGAVLPGISGGVLCVLFGLYQPIMEVLADPIHAVREHWKMLLPVGIGIGAGFLGIARVLGFILNQYPEPSVCVFAGIILGMLPSLFREAGANGRSGRSLAAMGIAWAGMLGFLGWIRTFSAQIEPGYGWYLFCGCCLALSIIVPGLSFSTLLMPLGLYTPFIDGIGRFRMEVIIPGILGAALTVVLLAKGVDQLLMRHYSIMFHVLVGIVAAATLVILPWKNWDGVEIVCLAGGVGLGLLMPAEHPK